MQMSAFMSAMNLHVNTILEQSAVSNLAGEFPNLPNRVVCNEISNVHDFHIALMSQHAFYL